MQQYYFLDNSGELKTSIQLQGDFVIAYALRLWKSHDKIVDLVEDIRGSCFNKESKTISYDLFSLKDSNSTYFLELDANISTIHSQAHYAIKLSLEQRVEKENWKLIGTEATFGHVSCNERGVFSKLGISALKDSQNKMAV